jgi:N-acetylglucosaminyl-diphospho-decaprenol L-rhamnosyltransferase
MTDSPLVSTIVLFHNARSASEAISCVKALMEQTIAHRIEVILVDNGAPEDAVHSLRSLLGRGHAISIVRAQGNIGYGKGNNLGAERARGEYILIINPDNRLETDALEKMVHFLQKNPHVGIVGPQLVFPDGSIRDSYRTFPTITDVLIKRTPLRFFFRERMKQYLQWDADPHETRAVDWMCGACLLMKRYIFEGLGGFDRRYFLFFEDIDLCRSTWERGLRVIYLPSAKAFDQEMRLSSGGIFSFFYKKTVRIHVVSAIKYFWKWRGKKLPRIS